MPSTTAERETALYSERHHYQDALLETLDRNLDRILDIYDQAINGDDHRLALDVIDHMMNHVYGYPVRTIRLKTVEHPDPATVIRLVTQEDE